MADEFAGVDESLLAVGDDEDVGDVVAPLDCLLECPQGAILEEDRVAGPLGDVEGLGRIDVVRTRRLTSGEQPEGRVTASKIPCSSCFRSPRWTPCFANDFVV